MLQALNSANSNANCFNVNTDGSCNNNNVNNANGVAPVIRIGILGQIISIREFRLLNAVPILLNPKEQMSCLFEYSISKLRGNKILLATTVANGVLFVRKDHISNGNQL